MVANRLSKTLCYSKIKVDNSRTCMMFINSVDGC
jgi:hypothetical protein